VGTKLRQEGWQVNHKRVQRLWREEGLRVPQRSPKRRRLGHSTVPAQRLQAERPNQVWALDFMFDTTSDGRPFKVLSMCDEFTRESVGGLVGRSITADDVVAELDRLRRGRGAPEFIRCDNGPEFVARAIRDWCAGTGSGTSFIDPGSPWQNAFVESFNSRARDELFAREIFDSILEAKVLYEDWRQAYNRHHPHSALGFQPPEVFAKTFNNPKLSLPLD
jgi:putative transposase